MAAPAKHKPKPVVLAERRVLAAERKTEREEIRSKMQKLEIERLSIELSEMRDDRNYWRAVAMKLVGSVHQDTASAIEPQQPTSNSDCDGADQPDRLLVSVKEIAMTFQLDRTSVHKMIKYEKMPTFTVRGEICASKNAIADWLRSR